MGREGSGVTESAGKVRVSFQFQGKRCRETLDMPWTASNKRAAERTLLDINKRIQAGAFNYAAEFPGSLRVRKGVFAPVTVPGSKTLRDALDTWLLTKSKLAKGSKKNYRNGADVWCSIFDAETTMAELTSEIVETRIAGYPFATGKSQNDYMIILRGAFALYAKGYKAWHNPLVGVASAKHQKEPPKPLSRAEMKKVLEYVQREFDPRIYAWFIWQFETGMRPEESIALIWADIDWQNNTARVSKARCLSVTGPVKTHEVRDVDLSPAAMDALRSMAAHPQVSNLPTVEVFQNPNIRRPFNDNRSQSELWNRALKACHIAARRSYNARHTFATLRLMIGAVPAYIARQLGHANAQMLYRTYSKWIDADKSERDRVQALLLAQESLV